MNSEGIYRDGLEWEFRDWAMWDKYSWNFTKEVYEKLGQRD